MRLGLIQNYGRGGGLGPLNSSTFTAPATTITTTPSITPTVRPSSRPSARPNTTGSKRSAKIPMVKVPLMQPRPSITPAARVDTPTLRPSSTSSQTSSQQEVAEPTLVQADLQQNRSQMWKGLVSPNGLEQINALPDLLGFRFDPDLYVMSGNMPTLMSSDVPVEYQYEYLLNVKQTLVSLLNSVLGISYGSASPVQIKGKDEFYKSLHGGTNTEGRLNSRFPQMLLYGILGVSQDVDGWPLKRSDDPNIIGTEKAIDPNFIRQRISAVDAALQSLEASIVVEQQESEVIDGADVIATINAEESLVQAPEEKWYQDKTTQLVVGAGLVAAALLAYKSFK